MQNNQAHQSNSFTDGDQGQIRNTLTFKEAHEQFFGESLSRYKLYDMVRNKQVPHIRVGTKILFTRDTLNAWIIEQVTKNYSGEK